MSEVNIQAFVDISAKLFCIKEYIDHAGNEILMPSGIAAIEDELVKRGMDYVYENLDPTSDMSCIYLACLFILKFGKKHDDEGIMKFLYEDRIVDETFEYLKEIKFVDTLFEKATSIHMTIKKDGTAVRESLH